MECDNGDAQAFRTLVQNTISRLLAALDAPRLRVIAFDPDLLLELAVFAGVRSVSATCVPPAITSSEAFVRALDNLLADVAVADDRLTAAGESSYWDAVEAGHPLATTVPFRLLIVGSSTDVLTEQGRTRLEQIRRLAAGRGLLVIEMLPAADGRPRNGNDAGTRLRLTGSIGTATALPGIEWALDPCAGETFIRNLCGRLVDRPRSSLAPTLSFADIVERIDDPWLGEADDGLEAVIGGLDVGDLLVRLRSENPPMPNALIGGAVGQGKSNLLLVLIHALAARYSPTDLEMVLIDLRDGVEFARLGPSPPAAPGFRTCGHLGWSSTPTTRSRSSDGSLTKWPERAELLKAAGATTLGEYRRVTGKVIPRLLVVVDEFQRLFEGDDDQAAGAASLVESIAEPVGVSEFTSCSRLRRSLASEAWPSSRTPSSASATTASASGTPPLSRKPFSPPTIWRRPSWNTVARSWSTTPSARRTTTGSGPSHAPTRGTWSSSKLCCSRVATAMSRRACSVRRPSPSGAPSL